MTIKTKKETEDKKPTSNLGDWAIRLTSGPDKTPEIDQQEAERLEREELDAAYQEHCYRWLGRIERWATKQSRENLAERFSLALLLLMETRKTSRSRAESLGKWANLALDATNMAQAARAIAADSIRKELEQREARRNGVLKKLSKDPKQIDKAKVRGLYDDWQAGRARYKNNAAFARHVVENTCIEDTNSVQRWIRQWRAEK